MGERRISEIWIYPVKSLAGIRRNHVRVLPKGLEFDRRWMLVDEHGRFLTQREHPEMALFRVQLENHSLSVSFPEQQEKIKLGLACSKEGILSRVAIWDDAVEAIEVNPDLSRWFSACLNLTCRLVFFPETNKRDVDARYAHQGEQVSLADGYPFLVIGQASLDLLNSKLQEPLPIRRFRPNFVFTGGEPHEEDSWKNFKIGSVSFEGLKRCGRCVLTTVNPDTGVKGVEPLKTLATYRGEDGKVFFGENVVSRGEGEVRDGDPVEIIDLKS